MNDDLIARAEALMPMLDGCHDYANIQAAEMVPELVAEVKRLTQLIDHTASNFLQLQPGIAWDGGIADAMKAAVGEIKRLRIENERAERAHESLDAMRKRQLAAKDAEICILKTEACAAQKNIKRRDDDIAGLMKELARWRQIAIEERAKNIALAWDGQWSVEEPSENAVLEATNELSIQIEEESSYLDRLETDYLSWVRAYYRDLGEEVAMQRAQDALEKIRKCHP